MDSSTWRSEDIWRSVYIRGRADQPSASRQKAAVDEDNNRNDHIEPYRWANLTFPSISASPQSTEEGEVTRYVLTKGAGLIQEPLSFQMATRLLVECQPIACWRSFE